MVEYHWPKRGDAAVIGKPTERIDGVAKATGAAKYAYDINAKDMLFARLLGCPHGHARVKSIDVSAAKDVPGVRSVQIMKQPGDGRKSEVQWEGDLIACVAADSDAAAREGVSAIKVDYEVLDCFVNEEFLEAAEQAGRARKGGGNVKLEREPGDEEDEDEFADKEIARLLDASDAVVEGDYGIHVICHCPLEPHGSTCVWEDGKLLAHLSTQNVSGTPGQFAAPLKITADDVTVHCDYIGGGFGSKFAADSWGVVAAQIAKETGRPVKLMLARDLELKNAGNRPSGFLHVRLGADSQGVVKVWDSHHWGTNGPSGAPVSQGVIPYVFAPPNRRRRVTRVSTNTAPARAWRAPNHPQGAAITQTAYDDVARKLGLDSFDVFMRNLPSVSNGKADVYAEQMKIAAEKIGWKKKWHPHGKGEARGSIVSGLGMALHTWGGGGHSSSCLIKIHPDGGVETFLGSQDLGTGTRTVIGMVVAETLGLPVSAVSVHIGSSKYPQSGPSGGSTTVAGVSESNRRGAQNALAELAKTVAPKLKAQPSEIEAKNGRVQVRGEPNRGLSWKEACGLLGMNSLEVRGEFKRGIKSDLSSSGVAGVQMAEVEVDRATGVIRVKKFVAVQDMGLVINPLTAKSQIYGAVIMGITYSLFEERVLDARSGAMLNASISRYGLARLGDVGETIIELYQPDSEYNRGVVGLGEPPVISPGAALSNAVCNALGVRVPVLPMTPQRVLTALEKAKGSS